VVLAVVALVAAMLDAEGYRTPELELHDAGVWISSDNDGLIGRTNTQVDEVDLALKMQLGDFDLLQADEHVLVHDRIGHSVLQVDGRTAGVGAPIVVPEGSQVDLGGALDSATAAVLDPSTGELWAMKADALGGAVFGDGSQAEPAADADVAPAPAEATDSGGSTKPSAELEDARELVVGSDGVAWAYAPTSGELLGVDGTGRSATSPPVEAVEDAAHVELSAVGAVPVVLDATEGRVLVPGSAPVDISELGEHPRLQLPGPVSDVVYVATDSALGSVGMDDGAVSVLTEVGTGLAARPVLLGGCAWSAWGGEPRYARLCAGAEPFDASLEDLVAGGKDLRFRTNRGKLVINELQTGRSAVLIEDGPAEEVDWAQAQRETTEEADPNADPTDTEQQRQDEEQKPPEAVDDIGRDGFGTRVDRSVVVDVLRNDTDPNGDVLVVTEISATAPAGAQVEIVGGGRAVQVTPAPGSLETVTFSYTIDDGQAPAPKPARVEVDVHGPDENGAPMFRDGQNPHTAVVVGRSVTHNVLADAIDPDGDALALVVPVVLPSDQGYVTAAVDGTIVYTAPPEMVSGGLVKVPITITDGMGQPTSELTAELEVTILAAPGSPPVARNDHARTVVGREVVVDVLANDSDADGDPLRLLPVEARDGVTTSVDDQQRVHVTPTRAGAFGLEYSITDGGEPVVGKLRIDAVEPTGTGAPIAVRDDVVLRPGVDAVVDVLANDVDPNGDVLVVQSVDVGDSGLTVQVVDRRYLRVNVGDGQPLLTPVSFTYIVTDGTNPDTGTVVVRPGPVLSADQAPTALDDQFTVRAGNVAAFDVLANDVDPEGGKLTISLDLPDELADLFFVEGGLLRFVAPATAPVPALPPIVYLATDPSGLSESATVTVHVVDANDTNDGPRPPDLTARTLAGQPVEIRVPVATMDPEGDDVTLLGVGEAPKHGSITEVGVDTLTYLPDLWAEGFWGTDEFTYQVRDALGALATATVRVGVGRAPAVNSPPVAIDDLRQVAEGGRLTIDVTANDSDPDDDHLSLVRDSVATPPGVTWTAEPDDGGLVVFDAQGLHEGDEAAFTYAVTDGILRDEAVVRVKVVPQADNLAPLALDDRHAPARPGEVVEIDVVANDSDPDGSTEDLVVTVPSSSGAEVVGNEVRLTMPAHDAAIVYTVTDGAGDSARAVARVRLAGDDGFPPVAGYDQATTPQDTPVDVPVFENDEVSTGTKELGPVKDRQGGTCEATADGRHVRFTPAAGYFGTGGCTYVLRDGPGDAAATRSAVGMVGVVVERAGNTPPTFIEQPLTITAGTSLVIDDLRAAVRDPDEGDLDRIELSDVGGEANGVTARLDGHQLTVSVADDAPGGEVALTVVASDGTDETTGTVRVTVIPRPPGSASDTEPGRPAVLIPDSHETVEGKAVTINVLANDQPAENGSPLQVTAVSQPGNGGSAARDGNQVVFTPAGGFHGTAGFTYTVDDGTGTAQTANVTVTVVGYPDAPAAPSTARENGAITLTWGVPAHNGAPITEYWITATGGPGSREVRGVGANTFRFDGLANGQPYQFKVAAVNRAVLESGGAPTYGPLSAPIAPDAIKPAPAAPTAQFDEAGGIIDVTWVDPGGEGSAVTGYKLEVSPPPAGGQPPALGGSTLNHRVEGLTNGTPYTFRVLAINAAGESPWSPASAPETPAAPPDTPAPPTIASEGDGEITITWQGPPDNGDPIRSYQIKILRNGADAGTRTISDPGVTQTAITTPNGEQFTFQVLAENKAGPSPFSPASAPASSFGVPGPVSAVSATEGDTSSVVTATEPDTNGRPILGYRYSANGAGWVEVGSSPTFTVNGLTNGQTYTFQVQARNERGWSDQPGASSSPVKPYGKPSTPVGVGGTNSGGSINWSWAPSDGNGRTVTGYRVTVDGVTATVPGTSHTTSGYADDGSTHHITVVALTDGTDPARNQSNPASGSVVRPVPPPSVTLSRGSNATGQPGCSSADCSRLVVSWQNLPAGGHSYECVQSNGTVFWSGGGLSGSSGSVELPCYADASFLGGVYVRLDGAYNSNVASW
jgi:hypothetical protein